MTSSLPSNGQPTGRAIEVNCNLPFVFSNSLSFKLAIYVSPVVA